MISRVSRRALPGAVLVGVVLLGAAACQDSPGPGTSTGSGTSSATPTGTPSESPSLPEPTPTAEPADGVLIDVPGATMNGLEGYKSIADYGLVQGWGDRQGSVILSPNLTKARSLDAWAKEYLREKRAKVKARRLDDAVVGGKYSAWVIEDTGDPLIDNRIYGVMFLDGAWTIDFGFYEDGQPEPLTEEERQAAIDSMLATFAPHSENP